MSSQAQRQWDDLRSEIMTRLSRCDVPADAATDASAQPLFFAVADEREPYYGPTREARAAVNAMFGLREAAGQLEWRAELRRGGKMDEAIGALGDEAFDTQTRCAFAMMLLDAIDCMAGYGPVRSELLGRIRWQLRQDPQVQSRMRYFWTHMEASEAVLGTLS